MTTNVKMCAVVICYEDNENPVTIKWKRGKRRIADCRPIYVPRRRNPKILLLRCTHSVVSSGKGSTHVDMMNAILSDLHLDTRIQVCTMLNVIVPKLQHTEVWEANAKSVTQLETVHMTAAKKMRMLKNED